ncbi:UPF0348 protein YlbM [Paraliobacillus quinghaiensis]|uniref:tRNA(Met) cytidine acetate ligase n=1 Tax=Paraliobacillus quinghaiensis TaxID=470815 RepID=A0A917TH20_9BACI|nr:nucleotidyltransferase [Paraliobacillus quinghaiensis]GGM20500.1 UPF0348 protein YlbM [Paraliobacillus quinghaiensis]
MQACGIIVEYNPFHYGHQHHLKKAKEISGATCIIACMSGNFLQRGEPAIIDKFKRTQMAIDQGVDIVIELPYAHTVQHSDQFAYGAVNLLNELGVSSICFGSEQGDISSFFKSYQAYQENKEDFDSTLKQELALGKSFPLASNVAFEAIGLGHTNNSLDLSKPNNILGFSYVKSIHAIDPSIKAITIKRLQSSYHDQTITSPYASATSIRHELIKQQAFTATVSPTLPASSKHYLETYKHETGIWHTWEAYFSLLQYRVLTMSAEELQMIHGVDEGFEHRLKRTAKDVMSFQEWIDILKTKRYTQTRIQRMFVHLLTNTSKAAIHSIQVDKKAPYIRLLGMSQQGKDYLNQTKKNRTVPIMTQLNRNIPMMMTLDERATDAYYAVIPRHLRKQLRMQEFQPPYQT